MTVIFLDEYEAVIAELNSMAYLPRVGDSIWFNNTELYVTKVLHNLDNNIVYINISEEVIQKYLSDKTNKTLDNTDASFLKRSIQKQYDELKYAVSDLDDRIGFGDG